jgi:hypothetical protein
MPEETDEIATFTHDLNALGLAYDLDNWHITDEWASKFRQHLSKLLGQAEAGNAFAQIHVASILLLGLCHASREEQLAHHEHDLQEMTRWLVRSARQGVAAAVDTLVTSGVGTEAVRVRAIAQDLARTGQPVAPGETWRRAYGAAVAERHG